MTSACSCSCASAPGAAGPVGLELGQHGGGGAQIFHFAAGKWTRQVLYFNRDRALADLGLAPEGEAADRLD